MSQEEEQQPQIKISVHDFFFEKWLYEPIKISDFEEDIFNWEVDWYSFKNHDDTTYKISSYYWIKIDLKESRIPSSSNKSLNFNGYNEIELHCKRKEDHTLIFYTFITNEHVVKIWQHPSLADIQFAELGKKYDKVLPIEDLKKFQESNMITFSWGRSLIFCIPKKNIRKSYFRDLSGA